MVLGESLTSHNCASYIFGIELACESGEQKHCHRVGGKEIGPKHIFSK